MKCLEEKSLTVSYVSTALLGEVQVFGKLNYLLRLQILTTAFCSAIMRDGGQVRAIC
jgi:hypothetical protein